MLEFDFTRITARDVAAFAKSDLEAQANALARCVVTCPYGPADHPDTYLDLPWTTYQQVQAAFVEALANTGKASSAPSGSI